MPIAFLLALTLVVTFAMWQGGAPERWAALVFIMMIVLQAIGRLFFAQVFDRVDLLSFAVDLFAFTSYTWLALFANRTWPLFIAAMQLLSCVAHFGREVSSTVEPVVYAVLTSGPTLAALAILLIGTLVHRARLNRGVQLTSWAHGTTLPAWIPQFLTR